MSPARKRLALVSAILGSFVAAVDATVVNVALPAIERDLGGGLAAQQWVSNAYLLLLGSLILVGGSLGDRYGERRIFELGVAGFGAASILCAIAPSIGALIAARALQGVFGALLTPSALAVIVATFAPAERPAAIGSWTAWGGIAMVVGPLVGGQIVDITTWRWIFAINVPFVIATIVLVRIAVPARAPDTREPLDVAGALLAALGLAGPVFALIHQPSAGWGALSVLGPLVVGVVLLGAFLVRESRTSHPMMPLSLFARRNFAVGNAETLSMYGGLAVLGFFLVLFLQQVAGYDALQAGMATLPITLVMFVLSRRAGALADRLGPRLFMGVGPLVCAGGLAWMLRMDADVDYATDLLPAILLFALGLSATVAPLTATVLADADDSNAGIASAINNAIARVAGLLAVAAIGAVVAASFASHIDGELRGRTLSPAAVRAVADAKSRTMTRIAPGTVPGPEGRALEQAARDASVSAFHRGILISALLLALGGLLGLAGIRNPRRPVRASDCRGGQLHGAPQDAGRARTAA